MRRAVSTSFVPTSPIDYSKHTTTEALYQVTPILEIRGIERPRPILSFHWIPITEAHTLNSMGARRCTQSLWRYWAAIEASGMSS